MKNLVILVTILFSTGAFAQVDVDSLLEAGREKAYNKEYEAALPLFEAVILETPGYFDAYMFKARIYAWQGNYEKSLNYLQVVKDSFPTQVEPKMFEATVLFWSEDHDASLAQCNNILADTSVEEMRYLKARLLYFKREYKPALTVLDTLVDDYPDNKDYEDLRWKIINLLSEDHVGVWTTYDHFSNFPDNPRYGLTVEAKKVIRQSPVIGRLNLARRFGLDDYQVQLQAYPRPARDLYFFVSGAYSPKGTWFPEWRFSGDAYFGLPANLEVSGGFRYMQFTTITFNMLTGYIGYYPGNNYVYVRYFKGITNFGSADIFQLVGRRYFDNQYHFAELRLGRGNSPDVNNINNVLTDPYTGEFEKAWSIGTSYQRPLAKKFHAKAWLVYNQQQPSSIAYYSILSANLGVWWRF